MRNKKPTVVLELFCGSATISKAFADGGYLTLSSDIRSRKGKCEPDFRADITKISAPEFVRAISRKYPGLKSRMDYYLVIWASVPCTLWSHAAGAFHLREGKVVSEAGRDHFAVFKKSLDLIEALGPVCLYIENPRGHLRFNKEMLRFCQRQRLITTELFYSAYGHQLPKPTNIFTNNPMFFPRPGGKFGRGNKSGGNFNSMTTHARQQIPRQLAVEISVATSEFMLKKYGAL